MEEKATMQDKEDEKEGGGEPFTAAVAGGEEAAAYGGLDCWPKVSSIITTGGSEGRRNLWASFWREGKANSDPQEHRTETEDTFLGILVVAKLLCIKGPALLSMSVCAPFMIARQSSTSWMEASRGFSYLDRPFPPSKRC